MADLVSIGTISIAGTRGFSIEGFVDPNEGRVDPLTACGLTPCLPGTTISVGAFLGSPGVFGTATLDGNQYELTGSLDEPSLVALELVGAAMLPQLVSSPTVVTAPFSVVDSVFIFDSFGGGRVRLNGSGIASLSLSPTFPFPDESPQWMVDQVRYDFNGVPAVVPEPSTMTLLTLGLAVTAVRARMRRRGDKA